jgi:hypothetical protein
MAQKTKIPFGCADLNLAEVSRVLAKHFGDITLAAKELRVYGPDLRRLTWAYPEVLEAAEDLCGEAAAIAQGQVIAALWSDDPRRQRWGCDRLLSSHLAIGHPLAPAGRLMPASVPLSSPVVTFSWCDADPVPAPVVEPESESEPETLEAPSTIEPLETPTLPL